jgi:hypothetical protein
MRRRSRGGCLDGSTRAIILWHRRATGQAAGCRRDAVRQQRGRSVVSSANPAAAAPACPGGGARRGNQLEIEPACRSIGSVDRATAADRTTSFGCAPRLAQRQPIVTLQYARARQRCNTRVAAGRRNTRESRSISRAGQACKHARIGPDGARAGSDRCPWSGRAGARFLARVLWLRDPPQPRRVVSFHGGVSISIAGRRWPGCIAFR